MGLLKRLLPEKNSKHNGNVESPKHNIGIMEKTSKKNLPLVDERGELNIELKGFPKLRVYTGDLFHTLVNVPNNRFYLILVVTYCLLFGVFAIIYYSEAYNNNCIPGVQNYLHALWFSVQTAMTIGYGGDLVPEPDCFLANLAVTSQSVVSLLAAYSLLGVVYARFSRPSKRVATLVFSHNMVLHEENGVPRLAFRVANIRKHQIIEVNIRMLVAVDNVLTSENESIFRFTALPVLEGSQKFLGLPLIISHPITRHSPLHGMSFVMMERCDLEILILLEGTDASTSMKLQARHSYRPTDIKYNHKFATMITWCDDGRRLVDFGKFHETVPVFQNSPTSSSAIPASLRLGLAPNYTTNKSLPPILQSPTALGAPDGYLKSSNWLMEAEEGSESRSGRRRRMEASALEDETGWEHWGVERRSTHRKTGGWSQGDQNGEPMDVKDFELDCALKVEDVKGVVEKWRLHVVELASRIQQCSCTGNDSNGLWEAASHALRKAEQL